MKMLAMIFFFSMTWDISLGAEDIYTLAQKAAQAEAENQFERAQQFYDQALALKADDPILHYNQGRVLYRLGQFEKAREHFETALQAQQVEDPQLEKNIRKNLGNTYVQKAKTALENPQQAIGELQKALTAYQEAREVPTTTPDDDISFNQDLTENLIQQIQELIPPQQSSRDDSQESDSSDSEQNQPQNSDSSEHNQQNSPESQESPSESPEQESSSDQQNSSQNQPQQQEENSSQETSDLADSPEATPLSDQEIEALLRQARLHERQRQQQLEEKQKRLQGRRRVEKDW